MLAAPPSPSSLRERGPPPPHICVHIGVHAHSYHCVFGIWAHALVCVCVYAHTYVGMYVLEGEPALLAFTSTAIEHLCLALLLVATVTKAKSGVAAAAKERGRERDIKGERQRESMAELITMTDLTQRIRKHANTMTYREMSTPTKRRG